MSFGGDHGKDTSSYVSAVKNAIATMVVAQAKEAKQVDFVEPVLDIARTDLDSSDIAQHLGKELGDRRIKEFLAIEFKRTRDARAGHEFANGSPSGRSSQRVEGTTTCVCRRAVRICSG
jgi:hypothetical protein